MAHHVPIRYDELVHGYENGTREKRYFLDIDTGELHPIFVDMIERGANTEDAKRIAAGVGTRYFLLPFKSTGEGYEEMENFIDSVDEAKTREMLTNAIEGDGAFKKFRQILALFPPDEERWFKWKEEDQEEKIDAFLKEYDIVPEDGQRVPEDTPHSPGDAP